LRSTTTMKRLVPAAILFLLLVGCAPETTSGAQMLEANRLYEAGQFAEAAALYQTLVDAGVEDGTLYYNLGNAYFKAGDLGHAVLNYCRAQALLPRDPDVVANLRLARAQTLDRLETEDGGGLAGFVRRALVEWTTLDEAAAAALGLWVLECALLVAAILWPRGRRGMRYAIVVVAAFLALGILSVSVRVIREHRSPSAVVVAQEVDVHSGPGEDYVTEFSLHAGTEVHVIEQHGDWSRIALRGDLQGWVPAESIEEL